METIIRLYYKLFHRKRCYKATLRDRFRNRVDCVSYGDKYLGNDWWLKKI